MVERRGEGGTRNARFDVRMWNSVSQHDRGDLLVIVNNIFRIKK